MLFVIASLLALLLLPPVAAWRTDRIRSEIGDVAGPAHALADAILLELAREVSAARGYALSGEARYLEQLRSARRARDTLAARLRPFVDALGPAPAGRFAELMRLEARWRLLPTDAGEGSLEPAALARQLAQQEALHDEVLRSAAALTASIRAAADERRERIRTLLRASTLIGAVLALSALVSIIFVARLAIRLRVQASQLERRALEERTLRELAHSLSAGTNVEEVLRRIAEGALFAGSAFGAWVERVHRERNEVEVVASSGAGAPRPGTRVPYAGSLAQGVIEARAPEIVADIGKAGRRVPPQLARSCAGCSALVLPLISDEEALGALVLLRQPEARGWDERHVDRTHAFASLGALTLRRALQLRAAERHAAALERSERRFRLLMDSVRDYAILVLDRRGRVQSWSPGAERVHGYRSDEIVGRAFHAFFTEEDQRAGAPEAMLETARRNGRAEAQGWQVGRDGSRFWADVVVSAMHDPETEALLGFVKVTRDLTDRKHLEEAQDRALEETRRAQEQAEQASQAKSQFLATMSHEIRTPINAIIGFADLLDLEIAGPLTPAQRTQVMRIQSSGAHLARLINDILDLSRVEAGELRIEVTALPLEGTAAAALALIEAQATAKRITLSEDTRCVARQHFLGDEDRVRQILVNLLGNAAKFTETGGRITVRCRVHESMPPDARLEWPGPLVAIDVEDSGCGMPAEQLARIFEPFVQLDAGYTRQAEGTGLGLSISRRLARLMGGDITVRSTPGQGSTFTLWLPALPAAESTDAGAGIALPARPKDIPGLDAIGRVLVDRADLVIRKFVDRVASDPAIPSAQRLSRAEIEDRSATLLVDIGNFLIALHAEGAEPSVLRESATIQRALAEFHGTQRQRLGWSPAELQREYAIMREEVEHVVADELGGRLGVDRGRGLAIIRRLLERAERVGRRRMAGGNGAA